MAGGGLALERIAAKPHGTWILYPNLEEVSVARPISSRTRGQEGNKISLSTIASQYRNDSSTTTVAAAQPSESKTVQKSKEMAAGYCSPASSRTELLGELEDMGVNAEGLGTLSINQLESLLAGLNNLLAKPHHKQERQGDAQKPIVLSKVDKSILKHFILAQGSNITSMNIARELGIPLSTIQRRKKRLEENLIETTCRLRLGRLGWREASLSVSCGNASTKGLGEEILQISDAITSVSRTIGNMETSLSVQVVFRTNADLMGLIDRIKEKEGVKKVQWSESIEVIGRNNGAYVMLVDSFAP
ncbi:MAG: Lrp/AsnC family transcriptional regulator [Nitrososphaera sp.]|jgi:DNA-binding Lrp family transcriptional regulator